MQKASHSWIWREVWVKVTRDSTLGEFHRFILKIQLASLRMQSRLCFFYAYAHISKHQTAIQNKPVRHNRPRPAWACCCPFSCPCTLCCHRTYCPHCQTHRADKAQSGLLPLAFWGGVGADLTVLLDKEKWPRQSSVCSQTAFSFDLGCIARTAQSVAGMRQTGQPFTSIAPGSSWKGVRKLFRRPLHSCVTSSTCFSPLCKDLEPSHNVYRLFLQVCSDWIDGWYAKDHLCCTDTACFLF